MNHYLQNRIEERFHHNKEEHVEESIRRAFKITKDGEEFEVSLDLELFGKQKESDSDLISAGKDLSVHLHLKTALAETISRLLEPSGITLEDLETLSRQEMGEKIQQAEWNVNKLAVIGYCMNIMAKSEQYVHALFYKVISPYAGQVFYDMGWDPEEVGFKVEVGIDEFAGWRLSMGEDEVTSSELNVIEDEFGLYFDHNSLGEIYAAEYSNKIVQKVFDNTVYSIVKEAFNV